MTPGILKNPEGEYPSHSDRENSQELAFTPESMSPATSSSPSTPSTAPAPVSSPPPGKRVYTINGETFSTLEEFYSTISETLIPGYSWGHNLDAFNDILGGGFGTPTEGFTLVWRNSEVSKQRLGYDETVRQLEKRLQRCHSSNSLKERIRDAERHVGNTVFDWLVEIILDNSKGGDRGDSGVFLVLH